MPTGYTADIPDGITFEQYAMNCARAFGALVTMRDEPSGAAIPEQFQPSTYDLEKVQKYTDELQLLNSMTLEQAEVRAESDYQEKLEHRQNSMDRSNRTLDAYEKMLEQAKMYKSPSPDHDEFAKFMIEQIETSIKFDARIFPKKVERLSSTLWLAKKIADAESSIKFHSAQHLEEVTRTNERNRWVKQLRESLEG